MGRRGRSEIRREALSSWDQFYTEQPSALFGGDPVGLAWANGVLGPVRLGFEFVEGRLGAPSHRRSKRSSSMTLTHAATKSRTNFSWASSLA